jgi:hypothetical protein
MLSMSVSDSSSIRMPQPPGMKPIPIGDGTDNPRMPKPLGLRSMLVDDSSMRAPPLLLGMQPLPINDGGSCAPPAMLGRRASNLSDGCQDATQGGFLLLPNSAKASAGPSGIPAGAAVLKVAPTTQLLLCSID